MKVAKISSFVFVFAILVLSIIPFISVKEVAKAQSNVRALYGYAWSPNLGFISFNSRDCATCTDNGARFSTQIDGTTGLFSGYAWSPNVGWISFNNISSCPVSQTAVDSPPTGAAIPSGATRCSPRVDFVSGKVSGWGQILSMAGNASEDEQGWIHLSGTNHQTGVVAGTAGITYDTVNKKLVGYAYESKNIGLLKFNVTVADAAVQTTTLTGQCDASATTLSSPGSVTFTAYTTAPQIGTAPYYFKWYSGNFTLNKNTFTQYFGVSSVGPTVVIKDSSAPAQATTATINCPNITVTPPTNIMNLYIGNGTNAAAVNQKSLSVSQNNRKFTLRFDYNINDKYACTPSISAQNGGNGPASSNWTSPNAWGFSEIDGTGASATYGTAGMTSSGISPDKYTFTITCDNGAGSIKTDSATLVVTPSSVKEK